MNKRISCSLVVLIIAISLSALLPNSNSIQQQPVYDASPNTSDLKQEVKQNMNQDNLCNRDDGCTQSTEGQQITGKDNTVSGLMTRAQPIQALCPLFPQHYLLELQDHLGHKDQQGLLDHREHYRWWKGKGKLPKFHQAFVDFQMPHAFQANLLLGVDTPIPLPQLT